ncbi:MspA family porin [Gordonia sputi]|uniref:MspA family protein n=1 Tax=Gordonia sputi NBRC 100414 TaxID=1089453 RepID=H5U650_9ACTN|nr:MspA family porin [Gordonia sputi]NKY92934.1 hypothetical protein [Gordonia sputi]GAB41208.1 hypothetical protein GOSPT_123_00130 [Gordonia sputi NBRC 100414]
MSKFSKLGRRGAAAVAVAAAAVIGATSMGAGHAEATVYKLADGYKKASGFDGGVVESWRKHETAGPMPSVANNGAGRSAWVSGVYTAKASGGLNGTVAVKLLVGCQVNIDGLSGGLSGAIDLSGTPSASASLSIPLTPGQVGVVSVTDTSFDKNGSASLQLSQFQIDVQKCGGFASARTVVVVKASKDYDPKAGTVNGSGGYVQSTLYGQPFSLSG